MKRLKKAFHFRLRTVDDEFKYYYVFFSVSYIFLLVFAVIRFNYTDTDNLVGNFILASILPVIFLFLWIISYYARHYFEKKFSDPIVFMNLLLGALNLFWWTFLFWEKSNDTKIFILYYLGWIVSAPLTLIISTVTAFVYWYKQRRLKRKTLPLS